MLNLKLMTAEELMLLYQTDSPENAYEAFNELYSRYSGKVYNFLKKKTSNAADSDDLLQKVFIKIHESKHLYKNKYKFEQWLFVIARTQVLDHFRSVKRYQSRLEKNELYENDAHESEHTLPEMDADQKELLEMKFVDELSYQEISKLVNKSEVSLRKTVSRLLARFNKGEAV
jgi:RNA polymerase sigma factor (sigma-70 family)